VKISQEQVSNAKKVRLNFLRNHPDEHQLARRAEDVDIGGIKFPFMSLLSDELIEAELADFSHFARDGRVSVSLDSPGGRKLAEYSTGQRRNGKPMVNPAPVTGDAANAPYFREIERLEAWIIAKERQRSYGPFLRATIEDPFDGRAIMTFCNDARTSVGKTRERKMKVGPND